MHREDNTKYLLYIEPKVSDKLKEPINDDLTKMMEVALSKSQEGVARYSDTSDSGSFQKGSGYKGSHSTECGQRSSNKDYIVDERVFNKEDYPDFINWYIKNINWCDLPSHIMTSFMSLEDYAKYTEEVINGTRYGSSQPDNTNYDRWVEFIGGKKNVFLRGFLKNFKLA